MQCCADSLAGAPREACAVEHDNPPAFQPQCSALLLVAEDLVHRPAWRPCHRGQLALGQGDHNVSVVASA
jgi:hypothetical protein